LAELTDTLRIAYDGFARRDMDAVLSVLDDDIEWDATDALAHTGLFHGHSGVSDYIKGLSEAWEEYELVPEDFTESPDGRHVMVLGTVRGRLVSGQEVDARFAHVLEVEHGKVTRLKVCLDREAALREMPAGQQT
jgi:uncharacterized protein